MTILLTILTICIAIAAVVCVFMSWRWSAIIAWLALVPVFFTDAAPVSGSTCLFWGTACALTLCLNTLLPSSVVRTRVGVAYMTVGALAGAFAGMLMPLQQAGMILGAAVGLLLGAIAFSRTPAGAAKGLVFPSRKWFNYTCAKGLPIVVVIATVAIAVMAVIRVYSLPEASL